jgi:hypothetical protein
MKIKIIIEMDVEFISGFQIKMPKIKELQSSRLK